MVENEYKCMLNSVLYQDIVNKLDFEIKGKKAFQLNYYYDTEDFKLDKNDITFRIRQKDEKLSIEVKYPVEKKELLTIKDEVISSIDKLPNCINVSKSKLSSYLNEIKNIILMGVLITERTSYSIKGGIKVDIDKSYYLGITDYELEIEFVGNMREEALWWLERLTEGKYFVPQGCKRERFMEKQRQMQIYSYLCNV